MRVLRLCSAVVLLGAAGMLTQEASASMLVRHMSLQQMCDAAGRIFRGTVLGATEGSVAAGGGQLRTIVYRLRVDENFKGSVETIKGQRIATLQMLAGRKRQDVGPIRYLAALDALPAFQEGHDYLVLATTPSRAGLSTTVGLRQGVFKLEGKAGRETAVNGNENAGLAATEAAAPRGPIAYSVLRDSIRRFVGR